jgi:hypothetical protein
MDDDRRTSLAGCGWSIKRFTQYARSWVLLGFPIRPIVVDQTLERTRPIARIRSAGSECRIRLCYLVCYERIAVCVHHDVVIDLIPHETLRSLLDQRITKQRTVHQIHWSGKIGSHPGFRGHTWESVVTDINKRHHPLQVPLKDLSRSVLGFNESDV